MAHFPGEQEEGVSNGVQRQRVKTPDGGLDANFVPPLPEADEFP